MLIVAFFSMLNSKYIAAFYLYWTDLCVNLLVVSVLEMIIQREKKWEEKKKVLEPFGGAVLCREKSAELVGRLGAGNKLLCKQLAAYKLSELVAQAGLKPFHKEQQDNP